MSKVLLRNDAGIQKEVKIGFSWTTFFFGCFVPLVRGDIKWAIIMIVIALVIGSFTFGMGAAIVGIVFSFKYNKIYAAGLLEKGYKAVNEDDHQRLLSVING